MHDTVQSAEGEEGGRGELAALMSHPFQKAAGSQKHFEKKKIIECCFLSFFLFLFFFLHPSLPVARVLAAAAVLPFLFQKKRITPLFFNPLSPSGAAVLFRVWTLSVCLSVCLTHSRPGSSASSCSWNLSVFFPYYSVLKTPPQATGVLHVQVTVRDRRTLPLPLSLPLSAPRGPPSPPVLPPSLPPPSSPWLMRSKGSDHIKRESASTLPQ